MLLDISRLHGGVGYIDRRFEPSAFDLAGEEFRIVAPVTFGGEVTKDGTKVRLIGKIVTSLETDCSRCLEPFIVPVNAALDLLLLPASANTGEGELAVEEDDLGVSFYENEELDLGGIMREQFYLALPMKPLCKDACKGLCPTCGVNRNTETCSCTSEWVDPRLEKLKELRPKD